MHFWGDQVDEIEQKSNIRNNEKNNSSIGQTINIIRPQDKEIIIRKNNLKLPLPSKSIISTSEFKVPPRGYVNLKGPKITLNLQNTDSKETLKLIAKLGEYGIVIIDDKNLNDGKSLNQPKITANFENANLAKVNFEGANLFTSSFKGANLYEANLLGANISGAIFDEANLSSAIWVDGKKCSLVSLGTCQ